MKHFTPIRNRFHLCFLLLIFYIFHFNVAKAQGETDIDKTLSPYFVVISQHPETDNLPLKETSAKVNIVSVIADVAVKQMYVNNGKNTLEAIYTFPLSTKAAVYAMKMTIGTRTITAKIDEKQKARKDYEKAKSEGKRASLLEQSRPNVFTMNVANIAVNDTIVVELKYTELLVPEKGIYSFVYPTVVGPRYSNQKKPNAGTDDNFVNTPYTKQGVMPSYKFGIDMKINAGIPIQNVTCSSHKMDVSHPDLYTAQVNLDPAEINGGNRDVVVNYSLQGNKIESGLMLYQNGDENFFLMMVQPPKKVLKEDIPPREYVFIVDVSGSMNGYPLTISKKLLRNLILNLNPGDKFNVVLFAGVAGVMSGTSVEANQVNIDRAIKYIDAQNGSGGTELMSALKRAYAIPRIDPELSRSFVIVTDGYIDVEKEAFDFIRKNSDNTNFFSFGVGTSVNRYLIEGMAFMGNGEPGIVTKPEIAEQQAEKFRNYINTPVLTRIKPDYGTFKVYDVEPSASPDMLAERPIVIFGKYKGTPTGTISVKGKAGKKTYKQEFNLANVKPNADFAAIRYLWARQRIKMLDYFSSNNEYGNSRTDSTLIKEITRLGLKYNLMTNYTSFIAIDEQFKVDKDGKRVTVKQPVPLPEGVSDFAVGYDAGAPGGTSSFKIRGASSMTVVESPMESNEVFTIVEEMPSFNGDVNTYLAQNIKYPVVAQENGIQGRVIAQFDVNEDGSISNIQIVRGVDPALDKQAVEVIQNMPKWTPGKQRGKAVKTKYTLPVNFKLDGGVSLGAVSKANNSSDEIVYIIVEQMPKFNGDLNGDLNGYLAKNIKYPEEARKSGIQGRVIIQFVVDKDGSISDVNVVRGVCPALDAEAIRVVKSMPNWTPGKQRGQNVRVKYTLPINFSLTK